MQTLNIRATVYALSVLATLSYLVCAAFRSFFPTWPMYDVAMWQAFFPGFSWTGGGVIIGLIWVLVYSVFAGLIFAGTYNFVAGRQPAPTQNTDRHDTT